LAYRVLELPAAAEPFDLEAYRASLPKPDENRAGELINRACRSVVEVEKEAGKAIGFPARRVPPKRLDGGGQEIPPQPDRFTYMIYVENAVHVGLPAEVPEFERWLDRVFAGEWFQQVSESARLPLGVVASPQQVYSSGSFQIAELGTGLHDIRGLLFCRTLQLQQRGDQAGALDQIGLMLALSRHVRHHAIWFMMFHGIQLERDALAALEGWLRGGPDAALVRKALAKLQAHERAVPPVTEAIQAEYLHARERLDDPLSAFDQALGHWNRPGQRSAEGQIQMLAWSHVLPWERLRMRRLLDALYAGRLHGAQESPPDARLWVSSPPDWKSAAGSEGAQAEERHVIFEFKLHSWLQVFAPQYPAGVLYPATLSRSRVAAAQLQVALVLYQLDHGKPAEGLADLVPEFLQSLPTDPFTGASFHYRVSAGEKLIWRHAATDDERRYREIPAGEGVLWSPGPDGKDNGGTAQGLDPRDGFRYEPSRYVDLIFLAPRVAKGNP
jgi:hypothetical protein